ncbi:hypothetical protein HN51_023416 [Arachis hypogaea]
MDIDKFLYFDNGFLVNETCIIVAEVYLNDNNASFDTKLVNFKPMSNSSNGIISPYSIKRLRVRVSYLWLKKKKLVNFKGLCKMEKDYVKLVEKSRSKYPSLIESHRKRKRSQRFNQLSFTTLGKLLHFLKTKKVKDMKSDHARVELQDLWEEAEIRFDDLSWLEPHVKSALTYFENAAKVKKLKANVVDLEEKAKTLKAEVISIDADLKTTKKELAKAEEGFVARDLDDRLGYGIIP